MLNEPSPKSITLGSIKSNESKYLIRPDCSILRGGFEVSHATRAFKYFKV